MHRIAVFSGPTATVANTAPLISDTQFGRNLRAQRLARPATLYVEAFSAHPLESDRSALYRRSDCYVDNNGEVLRCADGIAAETPDARPVYEVSARPEDGLWLLPYVARQSSGLPWSGTESASADSFDDVRQTHYPDASRLYEEIDTFAHDSAGRGRLLSRRATFEFFRVLPSGGRTLARDGTKAERPGEDFFGYYPPQFRTEPGAADMVRAVNIVASTLRNGDFDGAQWLEGSPTAEESPYLLNLVLATDIPIVGQIAQRVHGSVGADGDRNIIDGVAYIASRVWDVDETGRDGIGAVLVVDGRVFAARDVAKVAARPGGYRVAGGLGGAIASFNAKTDEPVLGYVPVKRHTWRSDLRLSRLPARVRPVGARSPSDRRVRVRTESGLLHPDCAPSVAVVNFGRYESACCAQLGVDAFTRHALDGHGLAGIVAAGENPYGWVDPATVAALRTAAFSGLPVVVCSRGRTEDFTAPQAPWLIGAGNLTPAKARILLIASLLKFGGLPPAEDPRAPTSREQGLLEADVQRYQEIFDSH